jgi:uncharacterized damage-inducible protein DinB
MSDVDPRYPIGRFAAPDRVDATLRTAFVDQIAAAPAALRGAVAGLSERQLDTPYRDGGWTVRQLVHHVPDSHLNAYTRFKLALTEDEPLVKTYEEARWAELPEARVADVALSLALLDALHARWVTAMRVLPREAFARTLRHPDLGVMSVDLLLALYAWHGRHHVAHVTALRARMGWR